MAETHIEWSQKVWNPSTGCDRTSPGCDNCYALTMAKRLKGMGQAKYQRDGDPRTSGPGFGLTVHEDTLEAPLTWRKPAKIFVNSMSDLFHAEVPDEFIARVFVTMAATPWHIYQLLTKRHGRMRSLLNSEEFYAAFERHFMDLTVNRFPKLAQDRWSYPLPNVHIGVSVEDQHWADIRIPALLAIPATVRFLSCEPLLGPVEILGRTGSGCDEAGPAITHTGVSTRTDYGTGVEYDCDHQVGVDWVIVGGESGPGARRMDLDWVRHLIEECGHSGVPIFVKQLGSVWAKDNAPGDPKGGDQQWWPADLRVREFPQQPQAGAA